MFEFLNMNYNEGGESAGYYDMNLFTKEIPGFCCGLLCLGLCILGRGARRFSTGLRFTVSEQKMTGWDSF
ncbi:hypothetical protein EYC84_003271 [Monilinia fructicola]|uniref:Uncharacterized protein n=1 Tax=Monilinia fructicola TaxID=38448 RepID=A0A5M9JVG7_MONFR|nr:hypothetical protein EYC84_003271 [Monilinia fructicola]